MVMNAFDTNFDGENEFYAVNTIAHAMRSSRSGSTQTGRCGSISSTSPSSTRSTRSTCTRNFFDYYDTGTTLTPTLKTVDLIMQCQAQRGILEFTFARPRARPYMFHAHQSEFTELGWMGMFDVVEALS